MTKNDDKSVESRRDDFMTFLKKNREDIDRWPPWKADAFRASEPRENPKQREQTDVKQNPGRR